MVKDRQERPEALTLPRCAGPVCLALLGADEVRLSHLPLMSQVQVVATHCIPPDRHAFPSGEGTLRTASVLSSRMGESVEKHLGSLFQSPARSRGWRGQVHPRPGT